MLYLQAGQRVRRERGGETDENLLPDPAGAGRVAPQLVPVAGGGDIVRNRPAFC